MAVKKSPETRAILVPFFANETMRQSDSHRVLFDFFKIYLLKLKKKFDMIYLLDSGWNFSPEDYDWLRENLPGQYLIENMGEKSHWDNMNKYAREVHYDTVLFIDHDTIIYDPKVLDEGFDRERTIKGILDGSGKFELNKPTILDATEKRHKRFRFCPYLTFVDRKLLDEIKVDFTPMHFQEGFKIKGLDWESKAGDFTDSMGFMTMQWLAKDDIKFIEMEDDRRGLYLEDNGDIVEDHFLETRIEKDPGYYHIRNFISSVVIYNKFTHEREEYEKMKSITPRREMLRLLGWLQVMADKTKRVMHIDPIVEDVGVSSEQWKKYIAKFKEYYSWLNG